MYIHKRKNNLKTKYMKQLKKFGMANFLIMNSGIMLIGVSTNKISKSIEEILRSSMCEISMQDFLFTMLLIIGISLACIAFLKGTLEFFEAK